MWLQSENLPDKRFIHFTQNNSGGNKEGVENFLDQNYFSHAHKTEIITNNKQNMKSLSNIEKVIACFFISMFTIIVFYVPFYIISFTEKEISSNYDTVIEKMKNYNFQEFDNSFLFQVWPNSEDKIYNVEVEGLSSYSLTQLKLQKTVKIERVFVFNRFEKSLGEKMKIIISEPFPIVEYLNFKKTEGK